MIWDYRQIRKLAPRERRCHVLPEPSFDGMALVDEVGWCTRLRIPHIRLTRNPTQNLLQLRQHLRVKIRPVSAFQGRALQPELRQHLCLCEWPALHGLGIPWYSLGRHLIIRSAIVPSVVEYTKLI
ncbi:hypothetical protein BRADI_3g08155v3 [Brachypodium distachyon]|uniref:Uncharacterized protein n=1 Tax=Brachypodium distachyon TaxID=15368 RepID=A0A2K2CVX8_BRADI|nr:hypothetical protein BRADI_3g08155v3 [Brachypodium distachyon]